ncbi:MAG TPA: rhodanese-like domain-containing protein [Acidobacteriaceae bacterium]
MELEISPKAYAELRKTEDAPLLLDCREPMEYEMARIEGAVLMPMGDIPSRVHQELDPDQPIVVVCHHGQRSLNVTVWLRQQGFEHVQSLAGGIDEWARTIDPAVPRY